MMKLQAVKKWLTMGWFGFAFASGLLEAHGAAVVIDGAFDDWAGIHAIYANPALPPGTTYGAPGVSYIKTYQEGSYVYFCYAALNPSGENGFIAFDVNHQSDANATYATMNADAAWMLGTGAVSGSLVLDVEPSAARWRPDPGNPGYELYEWCFYRDQQLADGTLLFPNPGDEVWFTVGNQGASLASSQLTTFTIDLTVVPEPTATLLGGVGALLGLRRRRCRIGKASATRSTTGLDAGLISRPLSSDVATQLERALE
jgi:hypothetical protein